MLRILHCVVNMNYGGYETFIMNLYRKIDKEKIQFDFIASNKGVFDDEIRNLGGKIYYTPFITKVGPFSYAKNVRKIIKDNNYKIVHSHMDKFSGMIMREAKRAGATVRIAHAHNTENEGGLAYKIVKNYYGNMIERYATDFWACSQDAAKWMFKTKYKNAVIINNGIDFEKFNLNADEKNKIKKQHSLENKFVVGHIGRFVEQKNHNFLIDIFIEILKINSNAVLFLVGDGILKKDIQTKIETLNIQNNVIFYGTTNEVNLILPLFDCFVFPSLHEGLGIALIEAQAANIPCVVSDNVPNESKISSTYKQLSLQDSAIKWAKEIIEIDKENMLNSNSDEFDINLIAKNITEMYINLSK